MAAFLFILATIIATPNPVKAQAKLYRETGHDDVAYAYKNAADEYREAIPQALAEVDPDGLHPEWAHELWRICKREAWCGRFKVVRVHEVDGWTGAGAYLWAVDKGHLDPVSCEEHRLADYEPVLRALTRWERKKGKKRPDVRETIEALPVGVYAARDFATRGGFGQNAARNLRRLGECVPPTALDEPLNAARVAATTFDECKVWDDDPTRPGYRAKRHCTCVEHTARWVGVGQWKTRPMFSFFGGKTKYRSIRKQCGERSAAVYALRSMFAFVYAFFPVHNEAT
ncbi:MAG: hypothetical protein CL819_15355 [Croceicoccus sp.]|nr:hypothetical protein [Croceicoccus sp.]